MLSEVSSGGKSMANPSNPQKVTNTFYDEAMELSDTDEDSIDIYHKEPELDLEKERGDSPPQIQNSDDGYEEMLNELRVQDIQHKQQDSDSNIELKIGRKDSDFEAELNCHESDSDLGVDLQKHDKINSKPYELKYELNSSKQDLEKIFEFISTYTPIEHELQQELKCFVPELIPCIGDIDAFIRVNRPDNIIDQTGLAILDEPSGIQSNPSDLLLRKASKANQAPPIVRSIGNEDLVAKSKTLDGWIESVSNLHSSKIPNLKSVDLENLMQVWPAEIEEYLTKQELLMDAGIALDTRKYAELILCLLGIPVRNGKRNFIEDLHGMFALYTEFKNSAHFNRTLE